MTFGKYTLRLASARDNTVTHSTPIYAGREFHIGKKGSMLIHLVGGSGHILEIVEDSPKFLYVIFLMMLSLYCK